VCGTFADYYFQFRERERESERERERERDNKLKPAAATPLNQFLFASAPTVGSVIKISPK
jgi:hypothetical protein